MGMTVNCPYCSKNMDIMMILMDKDLRYVFDVLPSFGTRYSKLVMGYVCLFGVTPYHIKAAKLRNLMEDMKRLFDAEAFSYEKRKYFISQAGIAEALDIMIKRDFSKHLKNHNYLKEVMISISEREGKNKSRIDEKDLRSREGQLMAEESMPQTTEEYCPPEDLPADVRKGIADLKAHLGLTK